MTTDIKHTVTVVHSR